MRNIQDSLRGHRGRKKYIPGCENASSSYPGSSDVIADVTNAILVNNILTVSSPGRSQIKMSCKDNLLDQVKYISYILKSVISPFIQN